MLTGLQWSVYCKRSGLLSKWVLLLLDSAHTTVKLLSSWLWKILPCHLCSPDLSQSDFHLFPKMKKHLGIICFQTEEDVEVEVKQWLHLQDASFYHQGFDCLICCCDMYLNRYGDCHPKIDCMCSYLWPICQLL
jgi:hypothetical protein